MTTDRLRWALAGAERPCPAVHEGHVGYNSADGEGLCRQCNGTGQVYVLPDSVRVPCDGTLIVDDMDRPRHFHAGIGWADGCLGYTPATDLETWLSYILREHLTIRFTEPEDGVVWVEIGDDPYTSYRGEGTSIDEAILRALAGTLQTQGIKLEVKE